MKGSMSFKCQEKKCPAEHEKDSRFNKQNKIALKIVLIILLAWIRVGGAASLTLPGKKALNRRWSLQTVFFLFLHLWFNTKIS